MLLFTTMYLLYFHHKFDLFENALIFSKNH